MADEAIVYIQVPEPIVLLELGGKPFTLKELIAHWVDNFPGFQSPISRVRAGIRLLDELEKAASYYAIPRATVDILLEAVQAVKVPVWTARFGDGPEATIPVPARRYDPLFRAIESYTATPPSET